MPNKRGALGSRPSGENRGKPKKTRKTRGKTRLPCAKLNKRSFDASPVESRGCVHLPQAAAAGGLWTPLRKARLHRFGRGFFGPGVSVGVVCLIFVYLLLMNFVFWGAVLVLCLCSCVLVCLFVFVCVCSCLFVFVRVCLFVCLSVCPSVCLFVCLFVCLPVCSPVCLIYLIARLID